MVKIGDTVQWATSRKPIGVVIHMFRHNGHEYAIVENSKGILKVLRVYEQLLVVK